MNFSAELMVGFISIGLVAISNLCLMFYWAGRLSSEVAAIRNRQTDIKEKIIGLDAKNSKDHKNIYDLQRETDRTISAIESHTNAINGNIKANTERISHLERK